MLKQSLQDLVAQAQRQGKPNFIIKNQLKEYLQFPVLQQVYSLRNYKNLVFTGGSCLRICYDLPRLSEDLDFDLLDAAQTTKTTGEDSLKTDIKTGLQALSLEQMADDLQNQFQDKYLLPLQTKIQGEQRIYLKFPLLQELGLAKADESNLLYVKLEFSQSQLRNPDLELSAVSKYGFNFVARHYSLPVLMAGKINALLNRIWFKGKNNEIDIKGRDFYDLYWFLQKGVEPDWSALAKLTKIKDKQELKTELEQRIQQVVTKQKLVYDLKNFFPDQEYMKNFCDNYQELVLSQLKKWI